MGERLRSARTPARVLVALATVFALFLVGGAADSTSKKYDQTQDELRKAKSDLATVKANVAGATAELQSVDAQLVVLQGQLRDLEADLAAKQQLLATAAASTQEATNRLIAETDKLAQVSASLQKRNGQFDARISATYKYGSVSYLDALLGAADFADFLNTFYYVRSVLEHERGMIGEIESMVVNINDRRKTIDGLRDARRAEESLAAQARNAVQSATEAAQRVTEQVRAESGRRRDILNKLEGDKATYEVLVASLEAESAKLAEELRKSQWRAGAPGAGTLVWPTNGRAGSGFGYRTHPIYGTRKFHSGVDIAGPMGQKIVSAAEGRIVSAGWRGGYGLAVVIDHGGGVATLYAHQSRLVVTAGQIVKPGEKIGEIGTTGQSTGPHLHFEIRVNGEPRDPMKWY